MLIRYVLIFLLFFGLTFFLDFENWNWLDQLFFALFGTGIFWLLKPNERG
ncbi:hypothetical protein KR50_35970 [Jeotgalibacillus campisalis]|uniref:Uncharacterized protein n=1 Tax=Jeotgalibacillus campisalis TaxID=220754 RepID=A0A0C2RN43_9BACL|nr:hypothetical protein KR50_35970 [Jeotgalibacillus campisalis]